MERDARRDTDPPDEPFDWSTVGRTSGPLRTVIAIVAVAWILFSIWHRR
jgi:hypothetical protein